MAEAEQSISSPRLADRLAMARHGRFVGREFELELFRSALLADEAPFVVLHIYGPGGIGKTTLLRAYAHIVEENGRLAILLDGHNLEPSPQSFLTALQQVAGWQENKAEPKMPTLPPNAVLLIDTYEVLAPLDNWLRENFLPQLSARNLVIIAGRNTPASAWRTAIDWAALTQIRSLRNLRPEESQTYLATRGVPEARHPEVLTFTHGHPLALSLVAELLHQSDQAVVFSPQHEPNVIGVLLERFVQRLPSPHHRQALEICAHVRLTTEALLAEVLGLEAHKLFTWLRSLSFIEQGARGLFPHDLAREVLDVDLRWRNPDSYRRLHLKVRPYIVRQLQETRGIEQQQATLDWLYLHRYSSLGKDFLELESFGTLYAAPAREQDNPFIVNMVRRHEGEGSAQIAAYWLWRQPQAFTLFCRTADQQPTGFLALLALAEVTQADLTADPAIKAAWNFAQRYGPVRPGEEITYKRFWMEGDTYQVLPSATFNMVSAFSLIQWLTHPKLAWSFAAYAQPEYARPLYSYINFQRSLEADFEIDGRQYGVFAHDWRSEPAQAWLAVMAERELATDLDPDSIAPKPVAPLIVLSEPEFAEAVRQALRDYTQPDLLSINPLLRSRVAVETAEIEVSPATVQSLLYEAAASLNVNPKDEKFYRAIWHTYLEPAPTQERAAELLGLPFSTYRYHLSNGIERIAARLWQRELYGSEP